MSTTSPIALFCYNRPEHLLKTLQSLVNNYLAKESELYIFSDNYKSEKDKILVDKVREIISKIEGFYKVTIFLNEQNKGLADSIITGVSELFKKYSSIIVLEDDLILSRGFLNYMNDALNFYKQTPEIFSVSGYCAPIEIPSDYTDDVFLFYRNNSWGWGTWKDRWENVDWEVSDFNDFIKNPQLRKEFNKGGDDCSNMLLRQRLKKNNSWAIRFNYACYKNQKLNIYPVRSQVRNIGADGSGTNVGKTKWYNTQLDEGNNVKLTSALTLNTTIVRHYKEFFKRSFFRKIIHFVEIRWYIFRQM